MSSRSYVRPGAIPGVGGGATTTASVDAVVAEGLPGPGTVFANVDGNLRAAVRPG